MICRPIAAGWDPSITGSCGNQIVSFLVLEIVGLLIDLTLLIILIPIFAIKSLQLPSREKLKLIGVFSVGFMSVPAALSVTP